MQINEIENELRQLLVEDKKSWVRIYELMNEVDQGKLYTGSFNSFTAWVNDLAIKTGVHVSLLWSRLKAGRSYAAFEKRAQEKGKTVPKMSEVKVSADNFNLIEKIAGNNSKVADELIEKVLDGGMGRSDLKNAWATVKADREARGLKPARVNAYDKPKTSEDSEKEFSEPNSEGKITATDVVLALSKSSWLDEKKCENVHVNSKYKTFTEFATRTGTTRSARRIDILVAENETLKTKIDDVNLHGIEIKVDKNDLLNDHKMAEYINFVDYFWIAVPEELVSEVEKIKAEEWGIISITKEKTAKIIYEAVHNPGLMREKTLSNLVLKLL